MPGHGSQSPSVLSGMGSLNLGTFLTSMARNSRQVAVGVNGRVWIRSPSAATTVLVANAILKSEYISDAQCEALVKGVLKKIRQEEK